MKKLIVIVFVLMFGCANNNINNSQATDCGSVQIGPHLFLKKIVLSGTRDRIYLMVNDQGNVVAGTTTNYQVTVGKTTYTTSSTVR